METKFTHFDEQGNAVMVDVSEKNPTSRTALAEGKIQVNREVMDAILHHTVKKGAVKNQNNKRILCNIGLNAGVV